MKTIIDIIPYSSRPTIEGISVEDKLKLKEWTGSTEDIEQLTSLPYTATLHIREDEEIRGIAIVYHNLIRMIAVNPLHRRQGYAKAMVDYMKSVYPILSCGSHPSNQQAWAFWSSQDFRIDISNFQKDQFLKQSLESDQIYRGRLLTQTWRISSACNMRKYHNLLLSYAICATLGILAFALAWKMINTKVSRE